MHIMTVCLGNICRSPAAESVLISRLAAAGLDDVTVSSAGTADYHVDERPHHLTREVGTERGYTFESVGVQFGPDHFDTADLILVMDSMNLANVLRLARTDQDRAKVHLLGEFAPDADAASAREVADPYGHPRPAFEAMYDQIEEAVDGLIARLRSGELTAG